MSYPSTVTALDPQTTTLGSAEIPGVATENQTFALSATTLYEVDSSGNPTTVPLGQSGPFVLLIDSEQILCATFSEGAVEVFEGEGIDGRGYGSTTIAQHNPAAPVIVYATSAQANSGGGSVQWVDLGLVDLVSAIMDGPTTLYDMPSGSFLSSIRFTDDPDTVELDSFPGSGDLPQPGFLAGTLAIGTEKSFGWAGFAWVAGLGNALVGYLFDTTSIAGEEVAQGYGPYAALDTGAADFTAVVLSAATVGPIQIGISLFDETVGSNEGKGSAVRVGPISAWAAATSYGSPASNTVATPGVMQKCGILANGTIWFNDGISGTSGGSTPDFAANAGGSVPDGGSSEQATVTGDSAPTLPVTISEGVNDQFVFSHSAPETFTIPPGVYTTLGDLQTAVGAATGDLSSEAFSTMVTVSNNGTDLVFTAVPYGARSNGHTLNEGNGGAAAIGITSPPDTFVGGVTDGIIWYDTTSVPPTVGAVHVVAEIVTPVTP
jgi:hypothetical protein